jgi:hypothetical protein
MIGILTVLSLGFIEKLTLYFFNKNKELESIKVIANYLFMTLIFLSISSFLYTKFDFSFFEDIKFWVALTLENLSFYLLILNLRKKNTFSSIAFSSFSTIYLIIIITYIYKNYLGIEVPVSSPYNSLFEVISFSLFFLFLNIFYFYDKLNKNDVKSPLILIVFAIFLANTLFFAILMFQTYQSFLVYSIIFLSFVIHFSIKLFISHSVREVKELVTLKKYSIQDRKNIIKNSALYIILYFFTFLLSVISGQLLAVEFFAIFKRTGSITSAYVIDGFILKGNERKIIKKKDILILITILLTGVYLFFR